MTLIEREFQVETKKRSQMIDVTGTLKAMVEDEGIGNGRMTVFVPHTTAGITINEYADPDVSRDILAHLERMVPWDGDWRHAEGNSAAHIKTLLTGSTVTLSVSGGALDLGTWQGVFFCEFDGPRRRRVAVRLEKHR
jgi:secondary thiamine-phosphate synthase enzyme